MISLDGRHCLSASADPVAHVFAPEVRASVAYPVNEALGREALVSSLLEPLWAALPDAERHPFIALRGEHEGRLWEMGTGYWVGTFSEPLFGIPATGRQVAIRYTEMLRFEDGLVGEMYLLPDWIDLMHQAGVNPLRPGLGSPERALPPRTLDGIYPAGSAATAESSRSLVMAMLAELGEYDGVSLSSMDLKRFWHSDFIWFGPGGIGTTRGIAGFQRHHQGPFLRAFPDRVVDSHLATIASGSYVGTGGWPHMHATHDGAGWLGLPPTGVQLELRVMDLWRRDGDLLRENWVAIDIPHMLSQMGLDVFEQMGQLLAGHSRLA